MGPCIVSISQYISNKMQRYTVYLYLETALQVSGCISTHHQERIQLYLQHLVFVTPLLLPAAIVEELELLCSSNSSTIAAGSSNIASCWIYSRITNTEFRNFGQTMLNRFGDMNTFKTTCEKSTNINNT
jgi:hypothetical protein